MPWYTPAAFSLRKPALASLMRIEFFSSSVFGSITPPRFEKASFSPLNRPPASACDISMSTSDFGRPIRSSRSSAWLLRVEMSDSSQNVPATMATNTNTGVSSSADKNANSSTASSRCQCECSGVRVRV